jgi:hypothetical protein
MHIYHHHHSRIHSAVQNLNHAIKHLETADREFTVAEVVASIKETGATVPEDYVRVIADPSSIEGRNRLMRAISEMEASIKEIKKSLETDPANVAE